MGHSETTTLRQSWVGEHSLDREKRFDNQKVLFGGQKKKPFCQFRGWSHISEIWGRYPGNGVRYVVVREGTRVAYHYIILLSGTPV